MFLYLNQFIPPSTPLCLGEDEGIWLMDAMRMLRGQVMYRDFFQFTAPGAQYVYFILFLLFGTRTWIPNLVVIILGLGFVWLSVAVSRHVLKGAAVFLPGLLFLTLTFRRAFAVTHHWWNALAVMGAIAVIIEKRTTARIAAAGVLCGLALWFNQTQGMMAVLGFAAFFVWEHQQKGHRPGALLKQEGLLLAACALTTLGVYADFVWKAGAKQLFEDTVVFVMRYYPAFDSENTWRLYLTEMPRPTHWYTLAKLAAYVFIRALLPLVYIVFFTSYRREARTQTQEPWDRMMLLSIVGLSLFVGIAPAAAWFRFCTVSMPAIIVLVWLVNRSRRFGRPWSGALWVLALLFALVEPWWWQRHWRAYLSPPGGRTALVMPALYERYQWVLDHTTPSELFFEAVDADMYFTLGLQNPTSVPLVSPTDLTPPEQVEGVIADLEKHRVRLVFWSPALDGGRTYRAARDHLGPLRDYLRNHYRVIKTFSTGDQVWERSEYSHRGNS
ncbi:MAG TPA: hypothetical protein VG204_15535 [Terriglobia bacterium]|nr:hypothetical protein [Terriglobia bacterium]